jgi:ketosteroid isomerase-like protein
MGSETATVDPAPVREYFAAFGRGDFEAVKAQFAQDSVVTVPGRGLLAGSYVGRSGFERFLEILGGHCDGAASGFRVDDVAIGEAYVIVREVASLARQDTPGRTFDLPLLLRFTTAGGRIARLDITPEDLHAYDAFWTP